MMIANPLSLTDQDSYPTSHAHQELQWLLQHCRAPLLRNMRQFAEQEITPPTGPWRNMLFSCDRQPFTRLFFDAVDSGDWREIAATGPSQTGKSLICFVIPITYHLFEMKEAVIVGVTDMDMARDKWERDLWPVIERTRYRDLFPRKGSGSRGGFAETITFLNGATLKFMSGGGGDKTRAYFTSRVIVFTEVDGLAASSATSVEADKIKQIEARARAYGDRARIYKECTVTTADGHIWSRKTAGTDSRIMLLCPLCGDRSSPEREHLLGWQDAETDRAAHRSGYFACPSCLKPWTEQDRRSANDNAILLHRGQTIGSDGAAEGPVPDTFTLGFRWSAVNNLMVPASSLAADEWRSERESDEENAEKQRCQFYWCNPYRAPGLVVERPNADAIKKRTGKTIWRRGIVPAECEWLTVGIDIGKRLGHWTLMAFLADRSIHIPDYGIFEIDSDQLGVSRSIKVALREFRDHCDIGWAIQDGPARIPDQVWVDVGWQKEERGQSDPIYEFLREAETDSEQWHGCMGRGRSVYGKRRYSHPSKMNNSIRFMGEQFYASWVPAQELFVITHNSDHWKMRVHEGFMVHPDESGSLPPGAMTLFSSPDKHEHLKFGKHIAAEHREEEYVPGEGEQFVFVRDSRINHWLDSTTIARIAGSFCGVDEEESESESNPPDSPGEDDEWKREDGRPFVFGTR